MNEQRVMELYNLHCDDPSDELLEIWQTNDHREWQDEMFEAVRQLLTERAVELPAQSPPVLPLSAPRPNFQRFNWRWWDWAIFLGVAAIWMLLRGPQSNLFGLNLVLNFGLGMGWAALYELTLRRIWMRISPESYR